MVSLNEVNIGVLTNLKVLPAEAGHVLDDQCSYLLRFYERHDLLPAGAVEVGAGVAVIVDEPRICEAFIGGVLFKEQSLILDAVGVVLLTASLLHILLAQAAVEDGVFFLACHIFLLSGQAGTAVQQYRRACPKSILFSNFFEVAVYYVKETFGRRVPGSRLEDGADVEQPAADVHLTVDLGLTVGALRKLSIEEGGHHLVVAAESSSDNLFGLVAAEHTGGLVFFKFCQ